MFLWDLKRQVKCLKYGIRFYGIDVADKVWLSCCALHNMLSEVDGLEMKWKERIPSYWEEEADDVSALPFALRRLAEASGKTSFDLSGMGPGTGVDVTLDAPGNDNDDDDIDSNEGRENATSVKNMSYDKFREKLVRHFNIVFHFKEVKWPRRIKN